MINLTSLWLEGKKVSRKLSNDAVLEMVAAPASEKADALLTVGGVVVGRLWKSDKTDKHGNAYYSGFFLDARCMVFRNNSDNPKAPSYRVLVDEAKKKEEAESNGTKSAPAADDDLPF